MNGLKAEKTSWPSIQIGPIVKEAILLPWVRWRQFVPLLALPVVLMTLLCLGDYWFLGDRPRFVGLLLQIPNFLIFSFFAVACHRFILIGAHSVSRFGIPGWPHREFRFFCWLSFIYVIGGITWVVAVEVGMRCVGFIEALLEEDLKEISIRLLGSKMVFFPWKLIGLIPCGYFIGRLSLLLPAIAIDGQTSLRTAWLQSKGNGWRMALLVGWMPILLHSLEKALAMYLGIYMGNQLTSHSLGIYVGIFSVSEVLLLYMFFTIEVAILSLSFLKLTGWSPDPDHLGKQ